MSSITDECGIVSHEEAREIQSRYNASHFRKHPDSGEYARYSIPADPKRDDDLRLIAYIKQCQARDATLTRLRDLLGVASDDEIVGAVAALQGELEGTKKGAELNAKSLTAERDFYKAACERQEAAEAAAKEKRQ